MSSKSLDILSSEERQHAVTKSSYGFALDRRDFVKLLGSGVLVCLAASPVMAQESGRHANSEDALPNDISAWLHVSEKGDVTVYTGKTEMGQNIRTSLAQQVAEELRVPVSSITMVMADTDLTPYDRGTFGSRTTPIMGRRLCAIAASARAALIEMAAQKWQVEPSVLRVADAHVNNPNTRQSVSYGEITRGQKITKIVPDDPPVGAPAEWHVAGTSAAKVAGRTFVTGEHKYTSDLSRPKMMRGKVLRPSAFDAKLVSLDSQPAEALPDVKVVRDGNFVGVAAPDEATASQALSLLRAQWNAPPQPSGKELFHYLRNNVDTTDDGAKHVVGSIEQGMAAADQKLNQSYTVAYIAHSPLEPRAAVAEWNADKLTVWTGTQRPFAVRDELAETFRIPRERVRVIVPDTGSAYGGKHSGETAVEAARLAKAAGKPVKVVWSREEELTWAYFRPAGVIDVSSGVRADGKILAWEYHNYNSGPAAMTTPYDIPNQKIEFHPVKSPLRQGSYRGLAATANHFVRESHMDELAHSLSMDPLAFRLQNITDSRLRAVFETAAEKFGWRNQKSSPERGSGIAGGFEKGGYLATCAELEIDRRTGLPRIRRVVEAFESGAVVNPGGLRNQIEGAIVQGIGGALFEAVRFDNGRVLNPHFSQYRVPRFTDVPHIEVEIIDRKDIPSAGAGETPIVGLAPAVGNAIFNATGVRLRSLPLLQDAALKKTQAA
jgi:nicotinate dehydrogenase subunit B